MKRVTAPDTTGSCQADDALAPPPVDYGSEWQPLPADDVTVRYLLRQPWAGSHESGGWQVQRLTGGAYLYRAPHGQRLIAKFYAAKTTERPLYYAEREMTAIRQARAILRDAAHYVVQPFSVWQGVLFLQYVPGSILEEVIDQAPRAAEESVATIAHFLALLHTRSARTHLWPDFQPSRYHAHKVIDDLITANLLAAAEAESLQRLVEQAAALPLLHNYVPVWLHGDATTGNFLFVADGKMVAVDWERSALGDPAADLGRLLAEVEHSTGRYQYTAAGTQSLLHKIHSSYRSACLQPETETGVAERAQFYRAVSLLRIVRNPWVSSSSRQTLITAATTLLAEMS